MGLYRTELGPERVHGRRAAGSRDRSESHANSPLFSHFPPFKFETLAGLVLYGEFVAGKHFSFLLKCLLVKRLPAR